MKKRLAVAQISAILKQAGRGAGVADLTGQA